MSNMSITTDLSTSLIIQISSFSSAHCSVLLASTILNEHLVHVDVQFRQVVVHKVLEFVSNVSLNKNSHPFPIFFIVNLACSCSAAKLLCHQLSCSVKVAVVLLKTKYCRCGLLATSALLDDLNLLRRVVELDSLLLPLLLRLVSRIFILLLLVTVWVYLSVQVRMGLLEPRLALSQIILLVKFTILRWKSTHYTLKY